jgi:diadenosine tetraphosphate (Ap4A) HIT family hydrolase
MSRQRVKFDIAELVERSTSGPCFICEFIRGNPQYQHVTVRETETAIAFLSKYPTLLGYVIVAPKEHREQVTGDFTLAEYLALQRFIYEVAEGMRRVLAPERIYVLSLGSQAANAHVHWHLAPLPSGVPLEQQQYHALMHEIGVVEVSNEEQVALAMQLKHAIRDAA